MYFSVLCLILVGLSDCNALNRLLSYSASTQKAVEVVGLQVARSRSRTLDIAAPGKRNR